MKELRFSRWACLLLLGSWLPASAQPHLIVSGKGGAAGSPSATMSVDLRTYAVQWSAPTPWMVPTVTADGRYLVAFVAPGSVPDSQLWLLDRVTGAVSTIPLGADVPRELKAHPRRFELYAQMTDGTVASITMGGVRPIYTCTIPGGLDLSGDGRRLALVCGDDIAVLDADSDVLIARFPTGSTSVDSPVASFDGTRVMVRRCPLGQCVPFVAGPDLAVWDVADGTKVIEHITPPMSIFGSEHVAGVVTSTPDRTAVLISTSWAAGTGGLLYGHRSLLIDFSTLAVRQSMPLVGLGSCFVAWNRGQCPAPSTGAFTPDGRYLVVGSQDINGPSAQVEIADVESNTLVASTGLGFFENVSLALASAPLAPANVAGTTSGRDVTVSWDLLPTSPAVTGCVLEAGSAPGLANLAVLSVDGEQRSLAVANVPPGLYYVRLRGVNVTGRSDASNEIVVAVR